MTSKETEVAELVKKKVEQPLKSGKPQSTEEQAARFGKIVERIFREERKDKILFARATSGDPRERRQFRIEIRKTRQSDLSLSEARKHLEEAWKAAGLKGGVPTTILDNPDSIQKSAVAAEMVARIAALPPELRKNPEVIYRKVAEAYANIDWSNLPRDQEVELRDKIENSFKYIQEQGKAQGLENIPKDREILCRGLGDFTLSANIPPDEPYARPHPKVPDVNDSGYQAAKADMDKWIQENSVAIEKNKQHQNLRNRLRELQNKVSQQPSDRLMKKYLDEAFDEISDGIGKDFLRNEAESIKDRIRDETIQWEGPGGGGRRGVTPEEVPAALRYEDIKKQISEMTGGKGLLDEKITVDELERLFPRPEHAALKARLLEVREWLKLEGKDSIEEHGSHALEAARQILRNYASDRTAGFNTEQLRYLQELYGEVDTKMNMLRQEAQPMSRFYLTPEERLGLENAPIETVDRMLDAEIEQLIRDPEGPRARAAMERLQLMQEYLFSDQYDTRTFHVYERLAMPIEGKTDIKELIGFEKDRVREAFRARLGSQKESFGRSFTIRWHAAQFYEVWSNADSPSHNNREFWDFLNRRMNEDDFFGLDGLYGNLVARAREKIKSNYEALLYDENGIKRGYDTNLWAKAVQMTLKQMKENAGYREIYTKDYLSGRLFKTRPLDAKETNYLEPRVVVDSSLPREEQAKILLDRQKRRYEEACSTIVSLANIRMIMSAGKYNLDVRFRPIHYSVASGQTPSTFLEKAKLAKLMRPWEFHMETWGSFGARPAFEKAQLRHRAEIFMKANPQIRKWGKDMADDMWARITKYKSGEMNVAEIKALCGDLDTYFFFTPKDSDRPMFGFKDTKGDMTTAKDKLAVWLGGKDSKGNVYKMRITQDRLNKEMQIYAGMLIDQQHALRPYMEMFESGYRRDSETGFLDELKQLVVDAFGSSAKGVFVGADVVGAANDYFMKMYEGLPEASGFLSKMAEASIYRPHSMALVLKEGGSGEFDKWLGSNFGGKEKFTGENGIYHALSMHFDEIRAGLLNKKITQIDYSKGLAGLTTEQLGIVKTVFNLKPEEGQNVVTVDYFKKMQDLSVMLRGSESDGLVKEFADIRYAPLFTKARWDDYPYELMQYPERMVSADDEIPMRVSDRFTGGGGEQQSGPFRRMWRDFGNAQDVFDLFGMMFDPDPKIRLKAIAEAYQKINGYQGPTHAAINYLMFSGGRLGAEKLRPNVGFIRTGPFLAGRPGNSDAWEFYDPEFKGKTVEELKHELDEDMKVASGKIINAPEASGILEAIESKLGISSWRKILLGGYENTTPLAKFVQFVSADKKAQRDNINNVVDYFNEHWPSGIQRQKFVIVAVWAALAITVAALSQANEQMKEEGKGGRH